jgi:hypothetical protein
MRKIKNYIFSFVKLTNLSIPMTTLLVKIFGRENKASIPFQIYNI